MTRDELTAGRDTAAKRFAMARDELIEAMLDLFVKHEVVNSPVAGGSGMSSNFRDIGEIDRLLQHPTAPRPWRNLHDEIRERIAALVATLERNPV